MEVELSSKSRIDMVVETPHLDDNPKNKNPSSFSGGSSSRFKGVMPLSSGKWGARISHKYKPYWLGAHQKEEQAARAYDRASIKLQRRDAPLNFPWTNYSDQESIFQSQYSNEEILNMIRDQTYSSKFKKFRSNHSSVKGNPTCNLLNDQGISYQLLFQKELTHNDVANKNLLIPKEFALKYFPPLAIIDSVKNEERRESIKLTFYDKHCRSWTFQYSFWKSSKSYVFTNGWSHFLKMNNLNHKDIVFFYRCENEENSVFYMIDAQPKNVENSVSGGNMEQEMGIKGIINNGLDAASMRQEEANKVLKLFGVQIGYLNHQASHQLV
ncbi:AP2/ERF and B3 domain-containing transcription factor At1g50680-like [Quercus robur]|uniref:AP2/ERF and B3 domain-containing transcription factor At1g50680-like n=1 Tax=Quercus robur TaxID=38942 RepID=UPI0021630B2B|nr:AP2/ERF and B3 domain-containing transcription factor At1g50680-like [Quercus robur]